MPAPIVIRNLSPETKKAANPGPDEPLIATKADLRDGSRGNSGGGTDVTGALFSESFDDQPDTVANPNNVSGGRSVSAGDDILDGWDGEYANSVWNPSYGDMEHHYSYEVSSLNARGGTGKAITHYRESSTQRVISPDEGNVVLPATATHVRIWISTSKQFSTTKSATATIDGVDYTFDTATGAEGATFDDSTSSITDSSAVGSVGASFASAANQRPHRGIVSNAIAVSGGETVSVTGGDLQMFDTFYGEWRARLGQFVSDSQLIKAPIDPENPEGTAELYVEFWLKFSEDWYQRGFYEGGWYGKLFRCASVAIPGNFFSGGSSGDLGPMLYWDYKADNFGQRNNLAFRGGPHGENYKDTFVSNNYGDTNFTYDLKGQAVGGGDSLLPNRDPENAAAHGTNLLHEISSAPFPTHMSLWGGPDAWTKVAFYVKMNSSPGARDGVMSQFINGYRTKHHDDIPWIEASGSKMVKWNHFSIGGNDNFHPYPNADKFEDSYAIDDIIALDHLPETLI